MAMMLPALTVCVCANAQIKIRPGFFGGCWWLSDYNAAPFGSIAPPDATAVDWIVDARATTMRAGGIAYTVRKSDDTDPDDRAFPVRAVGNETITNPAGYVKLVDDIRAKGFEPHLTVPFDDRSKTRTIEEQAIEAADIVRTVNKIHKRNVKVWIIGNEPNPTQGYWGTAAQVEQVRRYIRVFSMHMKNADPTIEVWGPDMESFNQTYFSSLLSGPTNSSSITGNISTTGPANGLPYIDKVSYHHYGGFTTAFTSVSHTAPTTSSPYESMSRRQRYVEAGHNLSGSYANHISDIIAHNSSRTKPLLSVINEFNMHDNMSSTLPSSLQTATSETASSTSSTQILGDMLNANTFLAGQFITEQMAAMLGTDDGSGTTAYTNSNIWSIREGANYGLIHGSNNERKPTFWHFWLMSRYFNGTFYPNNNAYGAVGDVKRYYKAYACRTADYIAVMLLNQTQSGDAGDTKTYAGSAHTFTINLDDTGGDARFAMGIGQSHNFALNPSSSAMIFLSCDGTSVTGTYSLSDTWVSGNLTAAEPVKNGTPPPLSFISPTTAVTLCNGASSATLTAPMTCSWYAAPNTTSALATGTAFSPTIAGLYFAKYTNACSGNTVETWVSKVVNDESPVISRQMESGIRCDPASGHIELSVENSSQSYTWAPQTDIGLVHPPNTNVVGVTPSSNTIYSVSTGVSCITTETFLAMVGSNTINTTTSMFTRDFIGDGGAGTHTNPVVFDCPDIWLSTTPNGNPIPFGSYVGDDVPHYLNTRVHNSTTLTSSGLLTLYWSKFGVGQSWQDDWNNKPDKSIYSTTSNSDTPQDWTTVADRVALPLPITVPANSNSVFSVPWVIPNPSIILGHPTGSTFHFCVVSTIETGCSAIPSTGYLQTLVMNSEKMSWKNFSVLTMNQLVAAPGFVQYFGIGSNTVAPINLKLRSANNGGAYDLLESGKMSIELPGSLYDNWVTEGANGYGISAIGNNKVAINSATAQIEDLIYEGDESATFNFFFTRQVELTDTFHVWIERYDEDPTMERDTMIGGLHMVIIPPECPVVNLTEDHIILPPDCYAEMSVESPDSETEYNWYTSGGSFLQTGSSYGTDVTGNTFFVVQGYKNGCLISDTCVIETAPGECGGRMAVTSVKNSDGDVAEVDILSISPNPANDELNIAYDVSALASPELVITNSIGQRVYVQRMNTNRHTSQINCSQFLAGLYQVSILSNNRVVKSKKVAIAR